VPFNGRAFVAEVRRVVERVGYRVVAASEGIRDARGRLIAESGTTDSFGHPQLGGVAPLLADRIESELKLKVHWAVPDYLQRSARHLASRVDLEQAKALGEAAVLHALGPGSAAMMTIVRESDRPYRWRVGTAPLGRVANRERRMPRNYITRDGWQITPACRRYLAPLIEGEAPLRFVAGLPPRLELLNAPVRRRLASIFQP
jgi:6-phosphofructokinase 1